MPDLTVAQEKARQTLGISPEEYLEILNKRQSQEEETALLEALDESPRFVWSRDLPPRKEGEVCGVHNGFEMQNGIFIRMVTHGEREAALVRFDQWDKEVLAHHPDHAW